MITWKDICRPIAGLIFIQPFVLLWLIVTVENPIQQYGMTGLGLQAYITAILIPFYAWYERVWSNPETPQTEDSMDSELLIMP